MDFFCDNNNLFIYLIMVPKYVIVFSLLFLLVEGQIQPTNRDGVLILNLDNFDNAVRYHKHLLIDFYAPWCKPCKEFEPEYYQMAKILSANPKNTIVIASYDATQDAEQLLNDRYKITSYPSFIFFIDGVPIQYQGNRNSMSLISWMRQIIDAPPPTELRSYEEINDFISSNDLSVLYFGKGNIFQDKNFWTFYQVTKNGEEGAYGYTLNEMLIKKAGAKPNSLLVYNNLKDQNQVRREFNQAFTMENIVRFILLHTLPDVPFITEKSEKLIFESNSPAFILFTNHEDKSILAEKNLIEVAQQFKKHYFFAISKITDDKFFDVLDRLGGDDKVFPQLLVVQPPKLTKFRYEGDVAQQLFQVIRIFL